MKRLLLIFIVSAIYTLPCTLFNDGTDIIVEFDEGVIMMELKGMVIGKIIDLENKEYKLIIKDGRCTTYLNSTMEELELYYIGDEYPKQNIELIDE